MEVARRANKKTNRHQRILDSLRASATLRVSALARELGVSGETIRRDLIELGEAGVVDRTYGGAVAKPFSLGPAWTERHDQMREERASIARLAMRLVQPGDVLMLEAGSTLLHFAQTLAAEAKDLTVITPCPGIAETLGHNPEITIVVCPGTFYPPEGIVLGAETVSFLLQFHADTAFVGSTGIAETGLNEANPGIAAVKRAIMSRSRRRVALMDHGKFDQISLTLACPLRELNVLVTDRAPGGALASALRESGVEVISPNAA